LDASGEVDADHYRAVVALLPKHDATYKPEAGRRRCRRALDTGQSTVGRKPVQRQCAKVVFLREKARNDELSPH
jgi:hypothetical protein